MTVPRKPRPSNPGANKPGPGKPGALVAGPGYEVG